MSKPKPISEREFQKQVVALLRLHGFFRIFHPYDSRRSEPGWPDLTAVSVRQRRVLYLELKTEKGRVSAAQQDWIDHLTEAGAEAHVVRPSQWRELERIIAGRDL